MKKAYLLLVACGFMMAMASISDALCNPTGFDVWDPTQAKIALEITGMFTETMNVTGPANVSRSSPYDPGDGHINVDTTIVSMNLTGTSVYIGPMMVVQSPSKPSQGTIRQIFPGGDFPICSDSFFDLFVEILTTLPFPFGNLHNDDPIHIDTIIYKIPPWGSLYSGSPTPVSLKDEEDNTIGSIRYVTYKIGTGPIPIGGISVRIDMLSRLAPYIVLISLITVATVATAIYTKRAKHEKTKQ